MNFVVNICILAIDFYGCRVGNVFGVSGMQCGHEYGLIVLIIAPKEILTGYESCYV